MRKTDQRKVSRFLSLVLRHRPEVAGLVLDPAGWVSVEALLGACTQHGVCRSMKDFVTVVRTSDKSRFALTEDGRRVRATYGHSVRVDLRYEAAVPPEALFHGTATRTVATIRSKGILPGRRMYVHLSETPQQAISVGRRHGRPVVLEIRAAQMHQRGHVFLAAPAQIWLVEEVPVEFIDVPCSRKGRKAGFSRMEHG
jgi:putative RNA 2'-phosphotransferase